MAKFTESDIDEMVFLAKKFKSYRKAAKEFGCSYQTISDRCHQRGFHLPSTHDIAAKKKKKIVDGVTFFWCEKTGYRGTVNGQRISLADYCHQKKFGFQKPKGANLWFKDGNRENYELDNLEFVTSSEYWQRKKISTIKTKNSRDNNLTMLKNLMEFKKNATLTEIDRNFFKGFIDFLTAKGLSTNTIRLYGILLKARMHEAYIDGKVVKRQDFFGIVPKKKPNEIHFLTLEELQTLFATPAPDKVKFPFMFCCFTGLRFSDVKTLKWEDIDNGIIVKRMEKTGEIVRIPLSENALRFMPKRGAKANLVFDLGPLNTFSRKLKEWANEAGITKNIHFHMSRHSFATLALSNGADLYTVSKLLGHREVTTTQVYAKVLDEGRKKAVDAIPDLLTEHNQLTPANQETL